MRVQDSAWFPVSIITVLFLTLMGTVLVLPLLSCVSRTRQFKTGDDWGDTSFKTHHHIHGSQHKKLCIFVVFSKTSFLDIVPLCCESCIWWRVLNVTSIYLLHDRFTYAGIESSKFNVVHPHNGTYDLCIFAVFSKQFSGQRSYVPLCGYATFELSIPA